MTGKDATVVVNFLSTITQYNLMLGVGSMLENKLPVSYQSCISSIETVDPYEL